MRPDAAQAVLLPHALDAVLDLIRAGQWAEGIIEAWRCLGVDLTDNSIGAKTVRPWAYAIPESQWGAICSALFDAGGRGSLERVNRGLDWMNIGPSAFPDEGVA